MQLLLYRLRYHPKSRLIMTASLILTIFLLLVINSASDDFEYVCIVDAGSTGSRIHVYKYRPPAAGDQLIWVDVASEKYEKFYPGLSSFEQNPGDLAAMATYFEPILNFGREHVPKSKVSSTALFVLASAGMRSVRQRSEQKAALIIDTAFKHLSESSEFVVVAEGVRIIEGTNEGLWGWTAANYLNGELAKLLALGPHSVYSQQSTKGIVEMGGESLQITFIPRASVLESDAIQQQIETVAIGNVRFSIFTNSWMGIGMEAAQNAYDEHLAAMGQRTESPCYNKGVSRKTWRGSGSFEDCYRGLSEMMAERLKPQCPGMSADALGEQLVCTPNGVVMPAIDHGLGSEGEGGRHSFYFIENFFYSAKVLGIDHLGGRAFLAALRSKGDKYCAMERKDAVRKFPKADEGEIDKTCFCAAWLLAIVNEGFALGQFNNFRVIRDIESRGNIDWALGFLVAEVPAINTRRMGPPPTARGDDAEYDAFRWILAVMASALMAAYCWRKRNEYRWCRRMGHLSTSSHRKGNGKYAYKRIELSRTV